MAIKKIVLIEPNKETAERLVQWCQEEGYEVALFDKLDSSVILPEKQTVVLVDIYPEDVLDITEDQGEFNAKLSDALIRMLSANPDFSKTNIILITPRSAIQVMAKAVETGVDDFMTDPSDRQLFLKELKRITAKLRPANEKTRLLNLNLINFFLVVLLSSASREDFFLLSPVIFNALLIGRIKPYIGEATITVFLARLKAAAGRQTGFMNEIRFQDGKIFMDGVDKASKGVGVPSLCSAFRDFIYGFVHFTRVLTSDILIERWDWERK